MISFCNTTYKDFFYTICLGKITKPVSKVEIIENNIPQQHFHIYLRT